MMRNFRSSFNRSSAAIGLALLCVACGHDAAFAPPNAPAQLYWQLRLSQHAVQLSTVAPYDTVQLTVATLTPSGAVFEGSDPSTEGAVRWASLDSSKVLVSNDGRISARMATDFQVGVVASRQIGNVTHADTVQVRVVGAPVTQMLTTFRARPEPPDSTRLETGGSREFELVTLDGDGQPMDVMAYFSASDTSVAKFPDPWYPSVVAGRLGETLVTATTWVYGVAKTDTFTLSVGYAMVAYPGVQTLFAGRIRQIGKNVVIGAGGEVGWTNSTAYYDEDEDEIIEGQPFDVVFEHPEQALPSAHPENDSGGGNITAIPSDPFDPTVSRRFRRFTQPGVYRYSIPQFGYTGTVIVRAP